jgi:two-component system, NtrC family, sensor kinase
MDFLVDSMSDLHDAIRSIRTSLHFNSPESVSEVLQLVAHKATEGLRAKGALVWIVNLETRELQWKAAYGLSEEFLDSEQTTDIDCIARLCEKNEVVLIEDVSGDPRVACPGAARKEGIQLMLDAPLFIQSPLAGLLRLHFTEPRTVGQVEKNFTISIVEQCACAIDKARLLEAQRKEIHHLALHTEKLSALGRMAAGIAHEINNPLAGIMLYGSRLSKKVPQEGPLHEGLQVIVDEATRCRGIIQNLLDFARDREPRKVATNILTIIDKALTVVDNEFHLHQIHLVRNQPEGLPEVCIDANQIEQVLINLLINAVEAIGENGTVNLGCGFDPISQQVTVEISDTGCGMSPEIMAGIFEPFYSTKAKGTGLGLSVSYGIVRNHRGNCTVSSQVGKGTTFAISLPVDSPDAPARTTDPAGTP